MKLFLSFAAAVVLLPLAGFAQDPGPGGPPPNPPEGGNNGGDSNRWHGPTPEQFRQHMSERVKAALKATDEEWAVIQPLMEKVYIKQREATGSRYSGRTSRSDRDHSSNDRPAESSDPAVNRLIHSGETPEAQGLKDTLDNDNSSISDIQTKLAALREQRKKAAAELAQAREDLRKVLTLRQEATLVLSGLLE